MATWATVTITDDDRPDFAPEVHIEIDPERWDFKPVTLLDMFSSWIQDSEEEDVD